MKMGIVRLLVRAVILALISPVAIANADENSVCAIIAKPKDFDHTHVTLRGVAADLKETTSRRGNDYTTFKLQDPSGCGALKIFTWGHPTLSNGDHVRVEGLFETEHHQGKYTFYDEVGATEIIHLH
jgi:hypothetical protein